MTANHTSPRKSGLVSRILDQPTTVQRPVQLLNLDLISWIIKGNLFLNNYPTGYSSVRRRACFSNAQGKERSAIDTQIRFPWTWYHGLGYGEESAQFWPQGYRLESHHRKGTVLKIFRFLHVY